MKKTENLLTEAELALARSAWKQRFARLCPVKNEKKQIEHARHSLLLSAAEVARTMGISRVTFSKIEAAEERGAITLNTLERVAAALNCELQYKFIPNDHDDFSDVIWQKLLPETLARPRLWPTHPQRRVLALLAAMTELVNNPAIKRREKWSQRAGNQRPWPRYT